MELRYAGFDQVSNIRVYKFDHAPERVRIARLVISVDMGLFLKHHVSIQEGPSLCARKLSADLLADHQGDHELTNDDLLAFVTDRAHKEAQRAESRRATFHRRPARTMSPFLRPGENH